MFRPMDSKERSLGSGLKDDKRVIGSVGFQSGNSTNQPSPYVLVQRELEKSDLGVS